MPRSESNLSRSSSPQKEKRRQAQREDENTCLYIGNIDRRLSQEKLNSAFAQYGQLDYCYIVYEPNTGFDRTSKNEPKQSRGYGFAKYKRSQDAIRAKNKLQGADLNGRRITVQISKRNKPRQATPGRYLGKKRQSPPHKSHRRRSQSRSSSRSRSRSHKKSKRYHEKKRRHQRSRSRSQSYRRRRTSYSKSPRR